MGSKVDLAGRRDWASAHASFIGAIAGVELFTDRDFVKSGGELGTDKLRIEPAHHTLTGGAAQFQPTLDSLTRLIFGVHFNEGVNSFDGDNTMCFPQFSRNAGTDWAEVGIAGGYALSSTAGSPRFNIHVIESPFPFDFMQDATEADDVDDTLDFRMRFLNTGSSSTGSIIVAATAVLLPGPNVGTQKKPRGAIFSVAGRDYPG